MHHRSARRGFTALVAAALLLAGVSAQAAVVRFDFNDLCCGNGSTIAGTAPGQSFDLAIFADNGGSSTLSQSWGLSDYLGATASIGGVVYTMSLDAVAAGFNATTDALGAVTAMFLSDFSAGNTDSVGNPAPGVIVNGARNIIFPGDGTFADANSTTVPQNWTASLVNAAVPGPVTLALLATGLAAAGFRRRRR